MIPDPKSCDAVFCSSSRGRGLDLLEPRVLLTGETDFIDAFRGPHLTESTVLAVHDFNGDGRAALATEPAEGVSLVGSDRMVFIDPKSTIAFDVNQDGVDDLVGLSNLEPVWRAGRPSGSLQFGAQALTYVDPLAGGSSAMLKVPNADRIDAADVNGDGRLDLVTNFPDPSVPIRIFLTGDQGLQAPITYDGALLRSVADVDSDGSVDLVFGDGRFAPGNGSGSGELFGELTALPEPLRSSVVQARGSIQAVELTGDGREELIVQVDHLLEIWAVNAAGDWQRVDGWSTVGTQRAVGDLNGDGLPDLVTNDPNGDLPVQMTTRLNVGGGQFVVVDTQEAFGETLDIADVDGDQRLDLIAGKRNDALVLPGQGDGGLSRWQRVLEVAGNTLAGVTPLPDGDPGPDRSVVVSLGAEEQPRPLRVHQIGVDGQSNLVQTFPLPVDASLRDVSEDGAVVLDEAGARVLVFLPDGEGGLVSTAPVSFADSIPKGGRLISLGDIELPDLNGDGQTDLVFGLQTSGPHPYLVYYGTESGEWVRAFDHGVPAFAWLADLNGDGMDDAISGDFFVDGGIFVSELIISMNQGDGGFFETYRVRTGESSPGGGWSNNFSGLEDFDQDGVPDLIGYSVVGSGTKGAVGGESLIWMLTAEGTVRETIVGPRGSAEARTREIADLNGDGLKDLVTLLTDRPVGSGPQEIRTVVAFGNEIDGFGPSITLANADLRIIAEDVDGNGRVNRLRKIDGGSADQFEMVVANFQVLGDPGDFDANGRLDLVDLTALQFSLNRSVVEAAPIFDLVRDGQIDGQDVDAWLALAGVDYGDTNLDGFVDAVDLSRLGENWNQTGVGWEGGDFNGDGVVDLKDLDLLGQGWSGFAAVSLPIVPAFGKPKSFVGGDALRSSRELPIGIEEVERDGKRLT